MKKIFVLTGEPSGDIPDNSKVMGYPAKSLKNFIRENK